jgi:hypothetical protein
MHKIQTPVAIENSETVNPLDTLHGFSDSRHTHRLASSYDKHVKFPQGPKNVLLAPTGAQLAPCPMAKGGAVFPGVKRPGRKAYDAPPSNAESKKEWSYTSTILHIIMI